MPFASPFWRIFVADLAGNGITDYSRLASDRVCDVVLDGPLTLEGTLPSDNAQVWLPYTTDGYTDPYLNEGTRLMWGFRRESDESPYYVPRAATLVQLVEDTAEQDNARTRFEGWDPWQYLFSRPVCDVAGVLPDEDGLEFPANTPVADIITSLLDNTIANHGHTYIDAGLAFGGTVYYTGTLDTSMVVSVTETYTIQQGTTVGQAWKDLTNMGVCDIYLEPIYDPFNRPNYLVQLNVVPERGFIREEAIFAWNQPGRSIVGLSRTEEGAGRANKVQYLAGPGGTAGPGALQTDAASVAKYGQYWAQQFFPGAIGTGGPVKVTALAQTMLALRKNGKTTVTFSPAPERSPRPWLDYGVGDRVPVWAATSKFRKLLGEGSTQYQRIYGWRLNISDDALETVDPMLTSPES
jgi:hypothetical protein